MRPTMRVGTVSGTGSGTVPDPCHGRSGILRPLADEGASEAHAPDTGCRARQFETCSRQLTVSLTVAGRLTSPRTSVTRNVNESEPWKPLFGVYLTAAWRPDCDTIVA